MIGGPDDPFYRMQQQMEQMHKNMLQQMSSAPWGSQQQRQPWPPHQRDYGPVIEEVHDVAHGRPRPSDGGRPKVDEPDDPPAQRERDMHHRRSRPQPQRPSQQQQQQHPHDQKAAPFDMFGGSQMLDPFASLFNHCGPFGSTGMSMPQANSNGSFYSYASYSSSTGPDGKTYERTESTQRGPNGVTESRHTVRDGRTGEERMRLSRGLHERQRTLERTRRAGATEETREELQGFASTRDARAFDREWQAAAQGLPRRGSHNDTDAAQAARHGLPALPRPGRLFGRREGDNERRDI